MVLNPYQFPNKRERERERERERALNLINDAMEIDIHGKKLEKNILNFTKNSFKPLSYKVI